MTNFYKIEMGQKLNPQKTPYFFLLFSFQTSKNLKSINYSVLPKHRQAKP